MNVYDLELRTDKGGKVYARWHQTKKEDIHDVMWFDLLFIRRLFAFVIDLSRLTFILLIKKFTLISLLCGHNNYISCPKFYYTEFISIPGWGRKYSFDLFFPTLSNVLSPRLDFMHFILEDILVTFLGFLSILTHIKTNISYHNSDQKLIKIFFTKNNSTRWTV